MGRYAILVAGAAVVALAVWAALPANAPRATGERAAEPVTADSLEPAIAACIRAQAEVSQRRAARGASRPGEPSDAGVVAQACAPLYHEAACRKAMEKFDEPPPAERAATVLRICAHAYCPLIAAPKPSVCARPDEAPVDLTLWADLRQAALERDIGRERAARVLAPTR
jgi:hypothetical protein